MSRPPVRGRRGYVFEPMANRRIERLNEQLKRELSILLRTRIRDPRLGGVVVTAVRASLDLTFARVLVRIGGTPTDPGPALKGLETAAPFLRRTLGRILHIRRVPELRFVLDQGPDRAARIEEILADVRPAGGWEDGAPDEDGEETRGQRSDADEHIRDVETTRGESAEDEA